MFCFFYVSVLGDVRYFSSGLPLSGGDGVMVPFPVALSYGYGVVDVVGFEVLC